MTLLYRLIGLVIVVVCASLGCGGGNAGSAAKKAAKPPASIPPPPPPPPSATGAATGSTAPSVAAGPSSGDIPSWAGQRRDEPFDVNAFLASRTAPPDNAAPLYMTALAPISRALGGEPAGQLEDQIRALADVEKLASGGVPASQVDQVVAAAAAATKQIDAAQAKANCVFVTGLNMDSNLAHAQAAASVAKLSVLQLHQARRQENFDLAEAAVRRGLRMSRDLQPRGPAVCQLVSIVSDSRLCQAVQRITLSDPKLTARQCDRLLALLVEHQQRGLNRAEEGLKVEYVLCRNTISDVKAGRLTAAQIVELQGVGDGKPFRLPRLNYDAEIAACNRMYSLVLEEAAAPVVQDEKNSKFAAALKQIGDEIRAAKPMVQKTGRSEGPVLVMVLLPAVDLICVANRRAAAELAGLQMLVALRKYEIAHRTLPRNLDAAAAESILKTVPIDPYSGSALRYAIIDGKPIIYSVGKDLQDDGGRIDWKQGTQPGDCLFVLTPRS
jgi:hypothetical protein